MSLLHGLRHAFRACRRAPLVSTLAIVAFALGIGVTPVVLASLELVEQRTFKGGALGLTDRPSA